MRLYLQPMPGAGFRSRGSSAKRGVPQDGPSGWYIPTEPAHFTRLGQAVPDYLWPCSEASGDLVSTIGSLTLTKTGTTQVYRQTVSGWSRPFVGFPDDTSANQRWSTTNAALDLALNQSFAMVHLSSFTPPPSGGRTLSLISTTHAFGINVLSTGIARAFQDNVYAAGVKDHSGISTVHQYGVYRNCALSTAGLVTDLESIVGTYTGIATTAAELKGLFGGSTGAISQYGWLAIYLGANAEFNMEAYLAAMRGG